MAGYIGGGIAVALIDAPAGATGGGSDEVFYENDQTITVDYEVAASKNALTAGPISINTGVTVTVADGARWVVV